MSRLPGMACVSIAAAFVAACGSAPSGSTPARPADPKEALLAAATHTTSQSFRADLTLSEAIHATGSAPQLQQLDGQTLTFDLHLAQQDPQHAQAMGTVSVAGHSIQVVAVLSGQTTYVSIDGGKTFHTQASAGGGSNEYSASQALDYLNNVGTVTDAGAGTADGVAVELYKATLDPVKMRALLQQKFSSLRNTVGNVLQAIQFTGGSLNAAVDGSGRLVTEDGIVNAAIDLGSVNAAYAGSKMTFNITIGGHFHDYGAAITVTPPPVPSPTT